MISNKLFTIVAFSVVGLVVLAAFGSRSLTVFPQLVAGSSSPYDGGNSQFLWATLGVFVFAMSEAVFLFTGRPISRVVTAIAGRAAQVAGFGIASFALFSGMVEFRWIASPDGLAMYEQISVSFHWYATVLTVGLWIAVLGQLVVAIARYSDSVAADSARGEPKKTLLRKLQVGGFVLLLLIVVGLFVFTTIFELELLGKLKQSDDIDLAYFANDLQGMMVYPFLAYLLAMFYFLSDCVRIVASKLVSRSIGKVE